MRILIAAFTISAAALATEVPSAATFNRDVLPVLQKSCQGCHRPGQVAPMSFLSYQSARPWAKAIKEAVLSKKMPPWSADSRYGRFLNNPTLTQGEINTLAAWVDGGALEGDARDKPAPVSWLDGWTSHPDVVVSMPEPFPVPAKGVLELTEVTVPNCFMKDTWVTAIEILPGNRSVVHHADLLVVPHKAGVKYGVPTPESKERDGEGIAIEKVQKDDRLRPLRGIEAVYVPGTAPANYGLHGGAKLIPAGSDFVIQVHYTPNGTATTDQTKVGFTLAKEKPARRFLTVIPTAFRDAEHFHIPPGDPNWETSTEVVFKQDAELVWFLPHMHLRGKDMTYRLVYPNGESQIVLSVKYDFDWQFGYDLEKPILVPKGTRLQVEAHFDNSVNNRFNPNPNREVFWGDQTWEEMMIPFFGVIVDPGADSKKVVAYSKEFASSGQK
ncbi:MAG TPA: cytochrome c [Bryobacteraceae bacterium]|nr:cytochrome c [Bryobacteraceae bacterium]